MNRPALENAAAILLRAVDTMSDGFALFDANDCIILCNQAYASMLEGFGRSNFDAKSMVGMSVETIIRRQVQHGQPIAAEYGDDIDRWVADRMALHHQADGVPHVQQLKGGRWVQSIRHRMSDGCMVVLRSDITHFKERERAAELLSQHDPLTGLPNQRLLPDRLSQALARARRNSEIVAVLLIDLDEFKLFNDKHGHNAGDEVLRLTAARLKGCLRRTDTVARYGADRFIVILECDAKNADVRAVAAKIFEAVTRPMAPLWTTDLAAPNVVISCSIGVSQHPRDGDDPDTLINLADAARFQAKQSGRGRVVDRGA